MTEDRVAPRTAPRSELRLDGPVVIVQCDEDPADMGEPRTVWSDGDGATIVCVPSFRYWEAASLDRDELRKAVEAFLDWQYRMPGSRRFTLTDLRAALGDRA